MIPYGRILCVSECKQKIYIKQYHTTLLIYDIKSKKIIDSIEIGFNFSDMSLSDIPNVYIFKSFSEAAFINIKTKIKLFNENMNFSIRKLFGCQLAMVKILNSQIFDYHLMANLKNIDNIKFYKSQNLEKMNSILKFLNEKNIDTYNNNTIIYGSSTCSIFNLFSFKSFKTKIFKNNDDYINFNNPRGPYSFSSISIIDQLKVNPKTNNLLIVYKNSTLCLKINFKSGKKINIFPIKYKYQLCEAFRFDKEFKFGYLRTVNKTIYIYSVRNNFQLNRTIILSYRIHSVFISNGYLLVYPNGLAAFDFKLLNYKEKSDKSKNKKLLTKKNVK